ncbi:MAG: hypothetical protein M0C28_33695 [Candidatus Moduliflexus flocculans]|nr:hypothetical protein [Candidatus Moduliflexus flocculans]
MTVIGTIQSVHYAPHPRRKGLHRRGRHRRRHGRTAALSYFNQPWLANRFKSGRRHCGLGQESTNISGGS